MANKLLVGTRKGVFTAAKSGSSWQITEGSLLGDPVSILLVDDAGAVHAAQQLGHFGVKIKRSTDGGASWQERAVPVYPPKPDDLEDVDPGRRTPIPWDLKSVWSLERGHPSRPGEIWCGTIPGGLFKSEDYGDSWSLVDSLWNHEDRRAWFGGGADYPGIHSVIVDPADPDTVRIGVSCGGIWISEDRGANWSCRGEGMRAAYMPPDQAMNPKIQDPHRVVSCASSPERLWIQHHNGIFKSSDGGQTCEEVFCENPSSFGFAAAVHPEDPEMAWFVPGTKDDARYPVDGRLVVTRTRDGGKTFDTLTNGLPQAHSYDLVYRHGLDIDSSGNCLAFGSTTGNLWISENQGDAWAQISGFLPPIYCVRFAD